MRLTPLQELLLYAFLALVVIPVGFVACVGVTLIAGILDWMPRPRRGTGCP